MRYYVFITLYITIVTAFYFSHLSFIATPSLIVWKWLIDLVSGIRNWIELFDHAWFSMLEMWNFEYTWPNRLLLTIERITLSIGNGFQNLLCGRRSPTETALTLQSWYIKGWCTSLDIIQYFSSYTWLFFSILSSNSSKYSNYYNCIIMNKVLNIFCFFRKWLPQAT